MDRADCRDSKPTLPLPFLPSFHYLQLARAGAVGTQGPKLLLEVSERVRTLTQAYFSPERPLHLSFTHLVCRTAIEGNCQDPTGPPQPRVPVRHCILSAPPHCVGLSALLKDCDSPAQWGPGLSVQW